jgi:ketosteroid isomerase-like protein
MEGKMVSSRELALFGLLFLSVPLSAQEWSAEQKEAWASEVAYWKALADQNESAVLAYLHDDYKGWLYGATLPAGKAAAKASWAHDFPLTEVFYHEVTPISILVKGDTAVAHYVIAAHYKNEKGEHESFEQRWTDTLVKEGGKWLLLADHGGPTSSLGN